MLNERTISFIVDNWPLISRTWNNDTTNFIIERIIDDIEEGYIPTTNWSCFPASAFILDIYGYPKLGEHIIVSSMKQLLADFKPGYVYHFIVSNHEFTIIYEKSGRIYYIDYYYETNRYKNGFPLFRFDPVTKNEITQLFRSYLNEDFVKWTEFHHGDELYYKSYTKDYFDGKALDNSKINFYQLEYAKYKIDTDPTVKSIMQTIMDNPLFKADIAETLSYMEGQSPDNVDYYENIYHQLLTSLQEISKKYL